MLTVALTGSIGSGKSSVSSMFTRKGSYLIDADSISRKVVEPGLPAWKDIVNYFGEEILNPDKTINRQKLGDIIFNNSEKRERLNQITHPRIGEEGKNELERIKTIDADAIVIMDIPLLIEKGGQKVTDILVVVYVTLEVQIQRLMIRDKINLETAKQRISSQLSLDEKIKYADYIIDNGGPLQKTEKEVERIYNKLIKLNKLIKSDYYSTP